MSDAPARERGRWSLWFIVSLCLNFFLIGVIVTGLVVARNRMIHGAMTGGGGGGLAPEVVLQMLPRSGAVKMCDALAGRIETYRRLGRAAIDARREVFRAFRAEPFDQAGFRAALARQTEAQVATLKEREATIAEVVERLTPEERKLFTREIIRRLMSLARPSNQRTAGGTIRTMCQNAGAASARDLPQ
ncbi:MAG: periplasmic heavy metal sensor [Alphaproteobacteria bacterium]|nr:periplasmic heavy metal sensor [Alphaproteobacteria bacterium]